MACSRKTSCYTVFGIGIALILTAIVLIIGYPYLFQSILKSNIALYNDSLGYNSWKKTPVPMYLDVYLFNWKNAKEVEKDWNVKPILEERGPYVFTESHERVDIVWNSNGTITFRQIRTWHFVPELSNGSLSDKITNLNPVAATIGYVARNLDSGSKFFINLLLKETKETLYITKTAKELIFDGYEDPFLKQAKAMNVSGFDVPYTSFGWFAHRNNSAQFDGLFTMYTGVDDVHQLGVLTRWNNYSHVPYYSSDCGDVGGTTGELWPPIVGADTVHMFVTDMCSSVELENTGTAEQHGVEGIHYSGTERTFDNGTKYSDMECYFPGKVVPSGVRNISECQYGAPAFLSMPHFYQADASYRERVVGMNPDKKLHELYVDLEPISGAPLDVKARAQISLLVQKVHGIGLFENAVETYMPMIWFVERATLTKDFASQIKTMLTFQSVGLYTGYGLCGIGVLLIFIGIVITYGKNWKGNEGEPLVT